MQLPERFAQKTFHRNSSLLLSWGMVALSHLATEIVIAQGEQPVWLILVKSLSLLAVVSLLAYAATKNRWGVQGHVTLFAILAMFIPFLLSPMRQYFTGSGHALEIQLLVGFRNVSLVSFIWGVVPRMERIAALTSLFTLLFCVSTVRDHSLILLSGLYLLAGAAWLCQQYWSRLKTESVLETQQTAPWFLLSTAMLLILVVMSLFVVPEETRMRMVEGFLPSSGGTGNHDPNARSGVGDGDALVAATKEAQSFAPIENAPFIEGEEPSLYDVFQDTYGAAKPPKKMQRAIALPPELFQPNHHRMAEAKKASKTFTLQREPASPKQHRHLKDTASDAILHLVGRVPAHLRHTVYDLFDGYEWYPQTVDEESQQQLTIAHLNDKPWICLPVNHQFHTHLSIEAHALRVMNVKTNCVLSPANLLAVHIDRCDRADLFRWVQQGIIAMDRETLPSMTVIHLRSGLVDPEFLHSPAASFRGGPAEYRAMPVGTGMEKIQTLARQWTEGASTDLERISAICQQLQKNYRLRPETVIPDDCENPVEWFLLEAQQGPDYLFASSAVLLLRSLGISSRAVSGFYAHPDHYDRSTQQTSVLPGDAHWWAEVSVASGIWMTIEPTPGYEVLTPPRSAWALLWSFLINCAKQSLIYWPVTLTSLTLLTAGIFFRRRLWARLLTSWWKLRYARALKEQDLRPFLIQTALLLDHKLKLANTPRPLGMTMTRFLILRASWLTTEQNKPSELNSAELHLFLDCYQWAAYAEGSSFSREISTDQIKQVCRQLLESTAVKRTSARISSPAQKV